MAHDENPKKKPPEKFSSGTGPDLKKSIPVYDSDDTRIENGQIREDEASREEPKPQEKKSK